MPNIDRAAALSMGKGTLFGVLANLTNVATRFLTIPIVISHVGLGGYGIWSIIMTSASYMRFGTAGLKSAFQKYVAEATVSEDFRRVNQLITTGSVAMLGLSLIGLFPVVVFAKDLVNYAGVPAEFQSATALSLSLLALIMILSNFGAAYEAIVMGGQRVDIARKFSSVLSLVECVAIIGVLHFGRGLFAMTAVMVTSEIALIVCCYVASKRLLPEIRISYRYLSRSVVGELVRFAGSYQLVNVLEILYASILPFAILKFFGARASGIYAVCGRLIMATMIIQEASVLPLLSRGAVVFASGVGEQARSLMNKAIKWTLIVTVLPLGFVAAFGTTLVFAWTGQNDPLFRAALWLISLAALFKAVSMTGLILYRATGAALLDNVRQVLRIGVLVLILFAGKFVHLYGLLLGLAAAELIGAVFMLYALRKAIPTFNPFDLAPHAAKVVFAAFIILAGGALMSAIPVQWKMNADLHAWLKVGLAGAGCLAVVWPVMIFTKCLSSAEQRTILDVFLRNRLRLVAAND
jgi:O-antigen/teichoic acid export membrane protein